MTRHPTLSALCFAGVSALLGTNLGRAGDKPAAPAAVTPSLTEAAKVLAELEAVMPKDPGNPKLITDFQARVVALVELNGLSTGEEFRRAATLAAWDLGDFRVTRMRYELLLAATAKGDLQAEKDLTWTWDYLLSLLGRPMRINAQGTVETNPDFFQLDPAPACIQAVLRDPAGARAKLASVTDNLEIKTLVDADQAVRKTDWSKLTEEQRKAIADGDRQRNARTIEIVNAGDVRTANDFSRASLVMQHSPRFTGFQLAHELAVCSLLLGDRATGRWLVTATYDRMLHSVGHDQRFGTQYGPLGHARVDESGICDAERQALGCPTLADARNRGMKGSMVVNKLRPELLGPDHTIRDAQKGVSAIYPADWKVVSTADAGSGAISIGFEIPGHASAGFGFYYRLLALAAPNGPEALLREQAQAKEKDRRNSLPDYTNRPDSLVFRQANGMPCLSWIADYTNKDGQRGSEYLVRVLGKGGYALFFLQVPAGELDALRPAVDAMADTVQLP